MKVSLNHTLQCLKQPVFKGSELRKDEFGDEYYEWSFPFDAKKYNCYLDVYPVVADKNGNYDSNDFKKKFVQKSIDWESFFKLAIDNNLITLIYSVILDIDKDNNILNEQQRKAFEVNAKATHAEGVVHRAGKRPAHRTVHHCHLQSGSREPWLQDTAHRP